MNKMMKHIFLITLALCLLTLPSLAMAADNTLSALGSATLTVAPDSAKLTFGYSCENADAAAAQAETAETITKILAAVQALGIEESQIATAYLNIYPMYNYSDADVRTLHGYRVEHMLSVTVDDIEIVGDVLDAALEAGATSTDGVTYMTTQSAKLYNEALALAIKNAQDKADAMAVAAGVWLGDLREVREQSTYGAVTYGLTRNADMAAGEGASIGGTLMAGQLEISASVELVYEVR